MTNGFSSFSLSLLPPRGEEEEEEAEKTKDTMTDHHQQLLLSGGGEPLQWWQHFLIVVRVVQRIYPSGISHCWMQRWMEEREGRHAAELGSSLSLSSSPLSTLRIISRLLLPGTLFSIINSIAPAPIVYLHPSYEIKTLLLRPLENSSSAICQKQFFLTLSFPPSR